MVGATFTAFLAALHYWFPKVTGRMYSERWAVVGWAWVFVGFVVTFTPQFLLGNAGMPRRYYQDPPELQGLHVISTVGALALAGGMLLTLGYLVAALFAGRRCGANPWSSRSFEWRSPAPPPRENFDRQPSYRVGAYDYAAPET